MKGYAREAIYKLLSPCFRETRGKASERVEKGEGRKVKGEG